MRDFPDGRIGSLTGIPIIEAYTENVDDRLIGVHAGVTCLLVGSLDYQLALHNREARDRMLMECSKDGAVL